jgi:hypothetical protein|tara:strand:+ start:1717 stop:3357 length:1641 start_codon:yes stop_codon:yes gene_type:complete
MAGGLLNLTSYGNENIILNGNPKKTFFKAVYKKHTNFGLQRFRIDYKGSRILNYNTPTVLDFKIPRYAEMLYDTYVCVTLPDIWSPFHEFDTSSQTGSNKLKPYQFRWIEELGSNMIREVEVYSGPTILSKFSGEYLNCLKERDFSNSKKDLWNRMTGNIPELNNPSFSGNRVNVYPNAMYVNSTGVIPSIQGRKLYIPLNLFFSDSSKMALPLVALQYQEISIKITFEPISRLYTINDIDNVTNSTGISYRRAPNPNVLHHQMWHFLNPPQDISGTLSLYDQTRNDWNSDIHLVSTYIFLGQDERRTVAQQPYKLLIKQVYEYEQLSVGGSQITEFDSKDMVVNYMFRFRRDDVRLRNEWSNYTNWTYNNIEPQRITHVLPSVNNLPVRNPRNFHITGAIGEYYYNKKEILIDMGVVLQGIYRENVMDAGIFQYIEKWKRTSGSAKDGLYCYNFCLDSDRSVYQPSGAMNLNKFSKVSFEFNTLEPPVNPDPRLINIICDTNNNPIGFRKDNSDLNEFNYDLKVFEERYNMLIIMGGRGELLQAR